VSSAIDVIVVALCGLVCLLSLADVALVVVHVGCRRSALAAERASISRPLTGDFPTVSVQLPVFNEAAAIEATIAALCRLDWPLERLEIAVLDDSTDETSAIVARCQEYWSARGVDIRHIRRSQRADFKAGALAAGLRQSRADHVAIFDADYRPCASFLRQAMTVLLSDERLAFVQTRPGYRNRDENLLTRAQAIDLDTLSAYEQAARSWAGVPFTFNGTCGIWRRRAIEAAGGWSGASLAEDQDLSFRAQALGWRARYLVTVSPAGELPSTWGALRSQRARWSTGTAQSFRALPRQLLARLPLPQAVLFAALSLFYATTSAVLMMAIVLTSSSWLIASRSAAASSAALAVAVAAVIVPKSIGAVLAQRTLGRSIGGRFVQDLLAMWLMQAALLPSGALALVRGYLFRQLVFLRTPKRGR